MATQTKPQNDGKLQGNGGLAAQGLEPKGEVLLKGKTQPVNVYSVQIESLVGGR